MRFILCALLEKWHSKADACPVKSDEPADVHRVIARSEATRRSPGTRCRFRIQYQEIATASGLAMTAVEGRRFFCFTADLGYAIINSINLNL